MCTMKSSLTPKKYMPQILLRTRVPPPPPPKKKKEEAPTRCVDVYLKAIV